MVDSDPRFPNRPTHPDFDLLAATVATRDARADAGEDFEAILAEFVDPNSAMYFATERIKLMPVTLSRAQRAAVAGLWLDGLVAGMQVEQRRSQALPQKDTDRP